jgi:hypothetical protein
MIDIPCCGTLCMDAVPEKFQPLGIGFPEGTVGQGLVVPRECGFFRYRDAKNRIPEQVQQFPPALLVHDHLWGQGAYSFPSG